MKHYSYLTSLFQNKRGILNL